MADSLKTIASFLQLHDAQMSKLRLESRGIEVRLADSGIVGAHPLLANAVGGVKLQVLASREKDAREILRALEEGSRRKSETASDSACFSCGEEMGESETRCPKCGWSYLDESDGAVKKPLVH